MERVIGVLVVAGSMFFGVLLGGALGAPRKRPPRAAPNGRLVVQDSLRRLAEGRAQVMARAAPQLLPPPPCALATQLNFSGWNASQAWVNFSAECEGGVFGVACPFLVCGVVFQFDEDTLDYEVVAGSFQCAAIPLACSNAIPVGCVQALGPGSGIPPGGGVFSAGIFQGSLCARPGALIVGDIVVFGGG